jgi:hypothetical protein
MMWIQDLRADGGVNVKKVKGTENPADQLTKYWGKERVEKGIEWLGMEIREGRADGGVEMARDLEDGGETDGKQWGETVRLRWEFVKERELGEYGIWMLG